MIVCVGVCVCVCVCVHSYRSYLCAFASSVREGAHRDASLRRCNTVALA